MVVAGALGKAGARWTVAALRKAAARVVTTPRRPRTGAAMRDLASGLADAIRSGPRPPGDVRALCRAVCEEMSARRGGRRVELRFERFPDEIEVTGLWVEFQDFDLVIVEERAEAVQQLVILGHELWHLHAGHGHHHSAGTASARADAPDRRDGGPSRRDSTPAWRDGTPAWRDGALTVVARDGSRETDESEADDFGHQLAAALRPYLPGVNGEPAPGPVQRSLGYRGRGGTAR